MPCAVEHDLRNGRGSEFISSRVRWTPAQNNGTEGGCSPLLLRLSELAFLLLFGASFVCVMYVIHVERNASLFPQYAHLSDDDLLYSLISG